MDGWTILTGCLLLIMGLILSPLIFTLWTIAMVILGVIVLLILAPAYAISDALNVILAFLGGLIISKIPVIGLSLQMALESIGITIPLPVLAGVLTFVRIFLLGTGTGKVPTYNKKESK